MQASTVVINGECYRHLGTLKDDAFARTDLLEKDGKKYIYKVSRLRLIPGLRLQWAMNRLSAHEVRMHRILDGLPGVPRLVRQVDSSSFIREFAEGRTLDRRPPYMRPDFFDEFL